jgi:hypothetical protein
MTLQNIAQRPNTTALRIDGYYFRPTLVFAGQYL